MTEHDEQAIERRQGERRRLERMRVRQFEQQIAAEQDERRRIALMLDAVGHAIEDGRLETAQELLANALKTQRQTIQSLRDLSFNLEPTTLRDLGFEPAVRHLAERLGLEQAVQVDVDVKAGDALAERAQVTFYQVIRESLDQAAGRRPSKISITVADTLDGGAELTVSDNGHLERRRENVEAIEERIGPLSGHVSIDRSDDRTTVRVALPGYAIRG